MLASSAVLLALAQAAQAFPGLTPDALRARQTSGNEDGGFLQCTPIQPPFDASKQYVSNQGDYAFVAPGPTDSRGPCPGLNAAANHNYMPHNGVATISQFITGTLNSFGMAQDLAAFLAVYGAIFDGNLLEYSIGGPNDAIDTLGLLGKPTGLSGSHNKYENDASPVRGDLYLYGNDYENQVTLFQQFFDYQAGIPDEQVNFGLDNITAFRYKRFQDSIATNPYFFNGPFSGAIASTAAFSFIYRFMANKSSEYPEGRLDRETLKSFYSMTGDSGTFKYTPGYEKIPDNWYKRHPSDDYSIPYFTCDFFNQLKKHDIFLSIGGNTGTTNSFAGLDPADLSGGLFNTQKLLADKNQAICYFFSVAQAAAPDLLEGILTDVTQGMSKLSQAFSGFAGAIGATCPTLQNLQYDQFDKYPGFKKSYNGYTGQ